MAKTIFFVSIFILLLNSVISAQDLNPYRFSKEETAEILLSRSKKEKTEGFIALGGGLALSGVGILLLRKDPYDFTPNSNGWTITDSDNQLFGKLIFSLGLVSTVSSPFLFVHAGRLKRKAQLLLSDEATSFLNKKVSVPSIGIQVNF